MRFASTLRFVMMAVTLAGSAFLSHILTGAGFTLVQSVGLIAAPFIVGMGTGILILL